MASRASEELGYVLPVRWTNAGDAAELGEYLTALRPHVAELIVVDGSPDAVYAALDARLPADALHLRPDPRHRGAMGKVPGVLTGIDRARCERVVIADDDVRWDEAGLERIVGPLDDAEVVRPQNYFEPLVWHARWDSARSLLNRVWSGDPELGPGDFPGTLGVRADFLRAIGGYDGDCLFENLELMRTVLAAGGRVTTDMSLYVARRPPGTRHFLSQRVRQAYDDFAIPARMALWLALAPGAAAMVATRRIGALAAAVGVTMGVAEAGRRRSGGATFLPAAGSLLAPAWLSERAVTSWLAVRERLVHGGVSYGGSRLARSAHSVRELRAATVVGSPST